MLAGEPYHALDAILVAERQRARELLKQINSLFVPGREVSLLLKDLLPNASPDIMIEPAFYCDYGYNIHAGKRVYFNSGCVILDVCPVTIGNHVLFGPGVHVYTATHPLDHMSRRKSGTGKPVSIGDDSWIGGNAIILPGVRIGKRCVIGAGAVVTKDIPDDTLAAGNPAQVIRRLDA